MKKVACVICIIIALAMSIYASTAPDYKAYRNIMFGDTKDIVKKKILNDSSLILNIDETFNATVGYYQFTVEPVFYQEAILQKLIFHSKSNYENFTNELSEELTFIINVLIEKYGPPLYKSTIPSIDEFKDSFFMRIFTWWNLPDRGIVFNIIGHQDYITAIWEINYYFTIEIKDDFLPVENLDKIIKQTADEF